MSTVRYGKQWMGIWSMHAWRGIRWGSLRSSKSTLFFDYGRNMFYLAPSTHKQINNIIPSNAYWPKFRTSDGLNRPKTFQATKKVLEESSVVGITCFHGINLRILNIYGGGEQRRHGIWLIEAVLHEVANFAELKLCYELAWVFGSALDRYNPDWMEVVEARIGRLHIYGHKYRRHVLYNIPHSANHSLIVSEEPDNPGYMMQHVIWSGRDSSSFHWTQKIVSVGRYWAIYLDLLQS